MRVVAVLPLLAALASAQDGNSKENWFSETKCADEGGDCKCSGIVKYGSGNNWSVYKAVKGSIKCTNGVFGDPFPKVRKQCMCRAGGTLDDPDLHTPAHLGRDCTKKGIYISSAVDDKRLTFDKDGKLSLQAPNKECKQFNFCNQARLLYPSFFSAPTPVSGVAAAAAATVCHSRRDGGRCPALIRAGTGLAPRLVIAPLRPLIYLPSATHPRHHSRAPATAIPWPLASTGS